MEEKGAIQKVLEAEAAARRAVERAQREAEEQLHAARAAARKIITRNEMRTKGAIAQYEQNRAAQVVEKLELIENAADEATRRFTQDVESNMEEIVDKVLRAIWPRDR